MTTQLNREYSERRRRLAQARIEERKLALERDNRQTLPELIASAKALGEMIWE